MGKQVDKLLLRTRLYAAEHVAGVRDGVKTVVTDVGEEGCQTGVTLGGFWAAYEQAVVTVLRHTANLTLADVVGQVEAAVLQAVE